MPPMPEAAAAKLQCRELCGAWWCLAKVTDEKGQYPNAQIPKSTMQNLVAAGWSHGVPNPQASRFPDNCRITRVKETQANSKINNYFFIIITRGKLIKQKWKVQPQLCSTGTTQRKNIGLPSIFLHVPKGSFPNLVSHLLKAVRDSPSHGGCFC